MYSSTKARVKAAQDITAKHYEEGVQAKSRKAVWRRYIVPTMGVCYTTYLSYLKRHID